MKKEFLILIAIYLALYIIPLGARPLVIPDETRYAEIPREMLATGDWIVPRLDGMRYFEKPVLGYWLNAISISLLGENTFAVRLPSALAVGAAALLIFGLLRRYGIAQGEALLGAAVFLTCFEVFGIGVFCVLDSVFSFFATATIISFYCAWKEPAAGKTKFLILAGISCGLAFLTKGFVALVLPAAIIVPFLIWQRHTQGVWKLLGLPLAVALLLALPWCLAIHFEEKDFWHYFFWIEHVDRFLSPNAEQHTEPFWFYLPFLIGGALPWVSLLPCAITGLKRLGSQDSLIRLAICWLIFPFLFFSISRGKLGTYILPCFPPLAILIIKGLLSYFASGQRKAFRSNAIVSMIVLSVLGIGIALIHTIPAISLRFFAPPENWKWMVLVAGLFVNIIVLLGAFRQRDPVKATLLFSFAPVLLMFSAHYIMPDRMKAGKMPGEFLVDHAEDVSGEALIVSDNYMIPAVCWFCRRSDIYLLGGTGEFEYGLNYPDDAAMQIELTEFQDFLAALPPGKRVVLIMRQARYDNYRQVLPEPAEVVQGNGFALAQFTQPTEKLTSIVGTDW